MFFTASFRCEPNDFFTGGISGNDRSDEFERWLVPEVYYLRADGFFPVLVDYDYKIMKYEVINDEIHDTA